MIYKMSDARGLLQLKSSVDEHTARCVVWNNKRRKQKRRDVYIKKESERERERERKSKRKRERSFTQKGYKRGYA